MKVLVGCEFSGTVRDAFIRRGHDAISCDLLPTESPGPHHQGGVIAFAESQDWDLAVFHPPCTYLTNAGVRWLYKDPKRWTDLDKAAAFFRTLLTMKHIPRIAVENPIMHKHAIQRIGGVKQTQVIQPWMFGHTERKATCLWLKNLPPLQPTRDVKIDMLKLPKREQQRVHYESPGKDRWKKRSITYTGIADAMAEQWGSRC